MLLSPCIPFIISTHITFKSFTLSEQWRVVVVEVDEGSSPLVKLSVASVIAGGTRQVISQQRLVQVICKM